MHLLQRDISKRTLLDSAQEAQEETGWKLVRDNVTPNTHKTCPVKGYIQDMVLLVLQTQLLS